MFESQCEHFLGDGHTHFGGESGEVGGQSRDYWEGFRMEHYPPKIVDLWTDFGSSIVTP